MRKKIILWGLGSLFTLLAASLLILPAFIDSSSLKKKIQTAVIQKNIGEIDYEKLYLSFIPLPHLTIENLNFSAPEKVTARVETMQIYPELLPLFRGQIRFSKIILDAPEVTAALPDEIEKKEDSGKEPGSFDLSVTLAKAIAPLTPYISGLKVSMDQGYVQLNQGGQEKLLIKDVDLNAKLSITSPRSFKARLKIDGGFFTVNQTGQKVVINCDNLNASLLLDKKQVRFKLNDLNLTQPALRLSGQFIASPNDSGFNLDLNGKDLDVDAIRTAALALGGDDEMVRDIFSYVQGGRIPVIHIKSKSKTIAAIGDMDNLIIQGRMRNGDISIDDIGLKLAEVDGEVLIANGLLDVSDASASIGKTTGRDGSLKIGLAEDDYTFHLDIMLNVQLHQLPSILTNIIDHEAFLHELSLIKNLKGTGKARLLLGERLDEINTKLEVSEINFSADYQRVSLPVTVSGGKVFFEEDRVRIEDLDARVGNSNFVKTFCNIEWENGLYLNIPGGRLNLNLEEFYPWVSSFDALREDLADVNEVEGNLDLSTLTLISPQDVSDESKTWKLSASGEVQKVTINTTQLPETLHLSSGKVQLAGNQLSFKALNAQLLDADLDLTGTLYGDINQIDRVNVSLNGKLGEKAIRFLYQSRHLSDAYAVQAPVQFENADIIWQSPDDFKIKGNLLFPNDVKIVTDFHYQPGEVSLNRLDITDKDSAVSCAFGLGKNKVNLTFKGFLHHQTLGRIFVDERLSDSWLKGDFTAAFIKDNLSESTLKGMLEGGSFKFPVTEDAPFFIEKFMLAAENKRIEVDDLSLAYMENRVALKGQVDMRANMFMLDLDASAGDLKWDLSEKTVMEPAKNSTVNSGIDLWAYPVAGSINLAAKSFSLGNFKWQPILAKLCRDQDKIKIDVIEANLCGIDTLGTLQTDGKTLDLDFKYTAQDRDFVITYKCLSKNQIEWSGIYDLSGQISARGPADALLGSAKGKFDFSARNGVITQDKRLSRILEVVNFTEIVKGRIPDLRSEGFTYDEITVQGDLENNMLVFNKIYMDGKTLDLLGKGTLDLEQNMLDLEALAAPFKTVDTAIRNIPGVNYLLAGSLISIPVRIRGESADPKVSIMAPSDISSNFLDFAERTIKSPVKLIQYWNPYNKSDEE